MSWWVYIKYLVILKWNSVFRKKEETSEPMYIYEQDLSDDK